MTQQLGHADRRSLLIVRPGEATEHSINKTCFSQPSENYTDLWCSPSMFDPRLIIKKNVKPLMVPAFQILGFVVLFLHYCKLNIYSDSYENSTGK